MVVSTSREKVTVQPKGALKDTLILHFGKDPSTVRERVYQETLQFIADNLFNTATYQFSDHEDLLRYVHQHKFSTVISTHDIPCETAYLLKGLGLVQILIGMRDDLLEISDIIVDPLMRQSKTHLVGLRYLLPSLLTKIPAADLAAAVGIGPDDLRDHVDHNEAETELLEIAQLYQRLEWDSQFFGFNVGYISCLRLTPNIEKSIKQFIRSEKIYLLEYLCNCHDRESVVTSEKSGYSFVDMRLTFEKSLKEETLPEPRENFDVRKGTESDIEMLKLIATDVYKYSRYYFDKNFDRGKVIDFYVNWVEKAILGQFDDYAYVLYHEERPIGFCTIKQIRANAVSISLFGISSQYEGQGLATYLLKCSLQKLKEEEGFHYVEVVTQGRNYEAQRLYQRCGFVTKSTGLWYHKWFH